MDDVSMLQRRFGRLVRRVLVAVAAWTIVAGAGWADGACEVAPACEAGGAPRWRPRGPVTWNIDYSHALSRGAVDARGAQAHVLPLTEVEAAGRASGGKAVADLKCGKRKTLVCYTNCGAWEDGHWNEAILAPERDRLLGKPMQGYPKERWLDIRRLDVMRRLVADKFQSAARAGCDAVVCDNTEAWITGTDGDGGAAWRVYREQGLEALKQLAAANARERTGFDIGYGDQIAFNRMLAEEAHGQCLGIGLINDVFQIADLEPSFDFALNEQCHHCGWCGLYAPFVAAGKPVLHLEFADNEGFCKPGSEKISAICKATRRQGLSTFSTIKRQASSKLDGPDRPQRCQ